MPRPKNPIDRQNRLTILLSKKERATLELLAKADLQTVSDWIRTAIARASEGK